VFTGEALGAIVLGVGDLNFALFARIHAAEVFGEFRKSIGAADFEHHFVRLDRVALDAGDAFEGHDGVIATLDGAGIDIDVLSLLLAQLFDAFGDVFIGNFGFGVRYFDALIILKLDFRNDFELRLKAERFAIVEVYLGDIGGADDIEVFGFELLLEVFGNQSFDDLLADVGGEVLANERSRGFAGAETLKLGALLNLGGDAGGFAIHFLSGNG
jgi:hypothetical protein